jgi:hypothetical protein
MFQLASVAPPIRGTASDAPAKSVAAEPWDYNLAVDAYMVPSEPGYVDPILSADRGWLHLEARYNYENLDTASVWIGRNFSAGKALVLDVTPMIGGVFGRTTGIAPGFEASLTYKKLQLSISNEYVFDTTDKNGSFYYSWPQLTYSPTDWLHVGAVAQHSKAFQTAFDVQRGFLVGVSMRKVNVTAYVFNAGWSEPTVVVECGASF